MICPECRKDWRSRDYRKHRTRFILQGAKDRSARDGVPFDLTEADIVIPVFCPVLGIELVIGTRGGSDASPSLDRFIPALGYVRGNVAVISNRANRMKTNATLEEHEALVRWMRAVIA
jgi:hypothetical protein